MGLIINLLCLTSIFPNSPQLHEFIIVDGPWCGPRALYFCSCVHGKERPLSQVVDLCKCDVKGYTSMYNLYDAAELMELQPVAMKCTLEQLQMDSRSAIIPLKAEDAELKPIIICTAFVDKSRGRTVA